jgi:hypothetical protein
MRFDAGTATSVGASTLTDTSKNWTTNIAANGVVEIVSGTGQGQTAVVLSNTSNTLTISAPWGTQPTGASYSLQYPENVYVRCRVLSVSKRPVNKSGVSYDDLRMEFVVDDPNFNAFD